MRWIVFLLALLFTSGCASVFTGTQETINVESTPSGADATLICGATRVATTVTPAKFTIKRNAGDCTLKVAKSGFVEQGASIEQGINPMYWANFISIPAFAVGAIYGWGVLVVYGGAGFHGAVASGFVIDSASGAMHTHRPNKLRLKLEPEANHGRDGNR